MFANLSQKPKKTPFDKKELAKFKAMLLRKRAELVGDVSSMETEALMGSSGSLSHLPQHMAEQGSDAYGQSLSLDIAAVDRRLIKEIDDALKRIELGTYGVCELTGKPIKADRLEELPWARYSIEAARELERRGSLPS
jgi:RNA polymerase-binding transcription factor DksA